MKKCQCGKEIDEKYEKCYECYSKAQTKPKKTQTDGFIDLNKEIKLQLWVILLIVCGAVAFGAWVF